MVAEPQVRSMISVPLPEGQVVQLLVLLDLLLPSSPTPHVPVPSFGSCCCTIADIATGSTEQSLRNAVTGISSVDIAGRAWPRARDARPTVLEETSIDSPSVSTLIIQGEREPRRIDTNYRFWYHQRTTTTTAPR